MKKFVTILRLRIEHDAPIKDLADKAAGRIFSMSGIDDVRVMEDSELIALPVHETPIQNGHGHDDVTEQMVQAMDSTMGQLS